MALGCPRPCRAFLGPQLACHVYASGPSHTLGWWPGPCALHTSSPVLHLEAFRSAVCPIVCEVVYDWGLAACHILTSQLLS